MSGTVKTSPVRVLIVPGLHDSGPTHWQTQRVKAAAYLVFGAPNYQVQR